MFFPEGQVRVHLYGQPVDMRRSYVTGNYPASFTRRAGCATPTAVAGRRSASSSAEA